MPVLVDKAVRDLAAYVAANLDVQLRLVETDEGLHVNALKSPSSIIRAFNPYTSGGGDGRPEIQVYDLTGDATSQRHDLASVQCSVDIVWASPSTDPQASEDFGRRWFTALYRTIAGKHPQTGTPESRFIVGRWDRMSESYESTTRHARSLDVEVRVHSPRP